MAKKNEFALANVKTIRFCNLKGEIEKVQNFCNLVSLSNQYDTIVKGLEVSVDDFETAHPGKNFWSCNIEEFTGLVENLDSFEEYRNNCIAVKNAITALPVSLPDFNALSLTDKVNIIVEVHKDKACKSVVLDKDMIDGVDFKPAIKEYYKEGFNKKCKDSLRSAMFKLLGTDGELFYGVKFTRADFTAFDLLNFLATFGGKASRNEKKNKDGEKVIGNYDYHLKTNWKSISAGLTTYLGVLLESRHDDIEINKGE